MCAVSIVGLPAVLSVSICRRDDFLTLGGELVVHDVPFVFRGLSHVPLHYITWSLLHSIMFRNG